MGKDVPAVTSGGAVRAVDNLSDAMVLSNSALEKHGFALVMDVWVVPDGRRGVVEAPTIQRGGNRTSSTMGSRSRGDNHRWDFRSGFRESS